ncbi:hypothetical protein [Thalassomonas actiniarum]|uniref:FHA domain-containing protein n=1 Tax=Thalassomonas actiniarum TaxID=485447 RepID=A0AAE9YTF5_9GAMM|nr:hypothetical protein [Thalassomonas actiniarum]WDE00453.1 hypothetical protein SG35_007380 [Thalassomonas actiniarum]
MPLTLIEINDHQLTLRQGEKSLTQSGYALVEKDQLLFGQDAFARGKLSPGNFYCRYWQQLGYEEITTPNAQVRHFADLAYLQLKALTEQCSNIQDTILMVPANYSQQQLSLLLGIAGSCQLKVIAVINEAVIKLAHHQQAGKLALLDLGLHHCNLNELYADENLSLVNTHVIPHKGLHDLYKHLATWLNKKFIIECRYDIFATARAEQSVYNYFNEIIPCEQASYQLNISDKTLKVSAREIREQISHFFAPVLASASEYPTVYITPRLKTILATDTSLEAMSLLDEGKLETNIEYHLNNLTKNKQIALITRLPVNLNVNKAHTGVGLHGKHQPSDLTTPGASRSHLACSHLAYKGHAYPLTDKPLYLSSSDNNALSLSPEKSSAAKLTQTDKGWQLSLTSRPDGENSPQVLINDKPARDKQLLYRGDTISLGREQATFLLLKVEEALQ